MSFDILGTSCDQCRSIWFNIALRPRTPEGSLGRTAQDVHLDSHTAPELCSEVWWWWSLLYSAIRRSRADSLRSHVILSAWVNSFYSAFVEYPPKRCTYRAGIWLVPHETAAISAKVLCTPYHHALCHFMQSHMHNEIHACFSCNLPPAPVFGRMTGIFYVLLR